MHLLACYRISFYSGSDKPLVQAFFTTKGPLQVQAPQRTLPSWYQLTLQIEAFHAYIYILCLVHTGIVNLATNCTFSCHLISTCGSDRTLRMLCRVHRNPLASVPQECVCLGWTKREARSVQAGVRAVVLAEAHLASCHWLRPASEGLIVEGLVLCGPAETVGGSCLTAV